MKALLWKLLQTIEDNILHWTVHIIAVFILMTIGGLWNHHAHGLNGSIQELKGRLIQHDANCHNQRR